MTYKQLLKQSVRFLRDARIPDAEFDASQLFKSVFGFGTGSSKLNLECLDENEAKSFSELIERRAKREPLQYILGEWEFYSMPFKVHPGVLIPRADTETLVDVALEFVRPGDTVFDYCTGSGCVGIAVEKNVKCDMTLFDISGEALRTAAENAALNKSLARVECLDITTSLPSCKADIILCNPPYLTKEEMDSLQIEVRSEPVTALFGGDDGLDFYRCLAKKHGAALKNGGYLLAEAGDNQAKNITEIFIAAGWQDAGTFVDLCGSDRVTVFKNTLLSKDVQ